MTVVFPQSEWVCKVEAAVFFYNLVSEAASCHLCCIHLVRSDSISPAHNLEGTLHKRVNLRRQEPLWAERLSTTALYPGHLSWWCLQQEALKDEVTFLFGTKNSLAGFLVERQCVFPEFTACAASICATWCHPCEILEQDGLMQIFQCLCFLCCAVSKTVIFLQLWCLLSSSNICETVISQLVGL